MKICEYEQYSDGNIHIDYANDLFLDFAMEGDHNRDYNVMLSKVRAAHNRKKYKSLCRDS